MRFGLTGVNAPAPDADSAAFTVAPDATGATSPRLAAAIREPTTEPTRTRAGRGRMGKDGTRTAYVPPVIATSASGSVTASSTRARSRTVRAGRCASQYGKAAASAPTSGA